MKGAGRSDFVRLEIVEQHHVAMTQARGGLTRAYAIKHSLVIGAIWC
jgi:hypothetical protein